MANSGLLTVASLDFDHAHLPPGRAFWSLTGYDKDGHFIANPINLYAIGDRDPLKFNADGSLDIYVQNGNPDQKRNRTGDSHQ